MVCGGKHAVVREKTENWNLSIKLGAIGESVFLNDYPLVKNYRTIVNDITAPDFITHDGKLVEVKSEGTANIHTGNAFIERYSREETDKPGGPWQAMLKGCTYFVHQFINAESKLVIERRWFSVNTLIEYIEHNQKFAFGKSRYVMVPTRDPNHGGTTYGFLVPRVHLDEISISYVP